MEKFKVLNNLDEIFSEQKERIKSKCEFLKINLTNQEKNVLNLPNFYKNENISLEITWQKLEKECKDFLNDKLFQDAKEKKKVILIINLRLIILF